MSDNSAVTRKVSPWVWVPSLYFVEGVPYVIVMTVSVIMYKRLDISNTDIALYTSWLYLPWVIKPFWSPVVDIFKTKRFWFITLQFLVGVCFAGVAFAIPADRFFQLTLAFLWLVAFSSATHDIAADGFYMIGLSEYEQSFFIGIRSSAYRLAMVTGQGLIVILAGYLETTMGGIAIAWKTTFLILSGMMVVFFIYHHFVVPKGYESSGDVVSEGFWKEFMKTFLSFFRKRQIGVGLAFLLLYRLGEAQLVKLASPFMLDDVSIGGLGLSTTEVGTFYGTFGIIALSVGGILGGLLVAKNGLKNWLWWMIISLNLPNLLYAFLAFFQPESRVIIAAVVVVEQFGYGFGFTAYLLFMIYLADGAHKTAHYAIATGFMALGMMLPGMVSGWIQEMLGYDLFFVWVAFCALPGFLVIPHLGLAEDFGKKKPG